jgi:hypothetical protein
MTTSVLGTQPDELTRGGRMRRGLREFFLLEELDRRVAARNPKQRLAARERRNAALKRLREAQDVRFRAGALDALPLHREGHRLLVIAFLASAGVDTTTLSDGESISLACTKELEDRRIAIPAWFARSQQRSVRGESGERSAPSAREAELAAEEFETSAAWLVRLIGPLSPNEVRGTRLLRVSIAATAVVALVAFAAVRLLSPTNLALQRPVTSSSRAYETTPEGAVDGRKFGRLGFHSRTEESPWLSIDLGRRYEISQVKVYGRDDCCFNQSTPLALEASNDEVSFRKVDERTDSFSAFDPWVAKPRSLVARFVRLKTQGNSVLVVAEVEVYGSAAHGP